MRSRNPAMGERPSNYRYQVGGSLPIDAPSYVTRATDDRFYHYLKNGDFCYVLNSRQMGKSSLRVQTMQKLRGEGTVCAAVDLTGFGTQGITPDKWYSGFIRALVQDCRLEVDWRTWCKDQRYISTPAQQLHAFVEQVLLKEIQEKIVIFVDEIDLILSQKVSADDFFALIRFFYNQRVDRPEYNRLTFALLGVATPSALIQDQERTPFNIGQAIYLEGFQLEEAMPLANGLFGKVHNPKQVLEEILDWTGGQPFLTQKLCQRMEALLPSNQELTVEQMVKTQVLENWESQDEPVHLRTICDRILSNKRKSVQLLGLYQKVLDTKVATKSSPEQIELRLSGLVKDHQGTLEVYNRIYGQIFNPQWIQKTLTELRPYAAAFDAWEQSQGQGDQLLAGQALRQALNWAVGKSLSDRDYDFIRLSQVRAEREKLQRNTLIRNVLTAVGLGGLLMGSILWGSDRWQTDQNQQALTTMAGLQEQVAQADRQNRPADALSYAIQSGQLLSNIVQDETLAAYPTTAPLLDLQQLLPNEHQPRSPQAQPPWNIKALQEEAIWDLDISPDGKSLAVSGWGNVVKVLQASRQQPLTHPDSEMIISTDFDPQGKHVATASLSGSVRLWSISGQALQHWNTQQDAVWATRFSPNGQYLATAGWDGTVRLWDLNGKQRFQTAKKHNGPVKDIRFSADGKWLVTAGEDGMIRLWTVCLDAQCPMSKDSQPLGLYKKWQGHRGWIWSIDVSPDSKVLASAGEDDIIQFWDLNRPNRQPKRWRHNQGRITQVRFSPDGEWLAISGWDGTVQIRDRNGRIFTQWQSDRPVTSLSFTPDQQTLLAGTIMGDIHQWPIWNLAQLLDEGCRKLITLDVKRAMQICSQQSHQDSFNDTDPPAAE
ncbi:MAG: AAA-like domain-containing protein [Thermosynechococcaceae cyanobacterium]